MVLDTSARPHEILSLKIEEYLSPNDTVMVYKSCSGNPFRIHEEEDISIIMAFLSRVEQSLHDILSDTRELLCPPVSKWILTGRDVNKDIEIDGITQLSVFEN